MLDPDYAVEILVLGMKEGWFTGKKLSDYFTLQKSNFTGARRIVNGTDRATEIADLACNYDADLKAEGYREDHLSDVGNMVPEPEKPEVATKEKPVTHTMRFLSWIASGGGAAALPFVD